MEPVLIYVDLDQCTHFECPHYAPGRLVIAASTLLKSKDYDDMHKNTLGPLRDRTIVLVRDEGARPGWYRLDQIL